LTPTARTRWPARLLVVAGLLLVLLFGVRSVRSYLHLQQIAQASRGGDMILVRGWMTVPYLATAYGVPARPLFEVLGIEPGDGRAKTLRELAADAALDDRAQVVEVLHRAIAAQRAGRPADGGREPGQ
jgi:hypothetical protein